MSHDRLCFVSGRWAALVGRLKTQTGGSKKEDSTWDEGFSYSEALTPHTHDLLLGIKPKICAQNYVPQSRFALQISKYVYLRREIT